MVIVPPDDEIDMEKLEEDVKSIQMEGLIWGPCKFGSSLTPSYVSNDRAGILIYSEISQQNFAQLVMESSCCESYSYMKRTFFVSTPLS